MNETVVLQDNRTGAIFKAHEGCWRMSTIVRPNVREKYTMIGPGFPMDIACNYAYCPRS